MTIHTPAVGTIIKSFDFPGFDDNYMIGEVTSVEGELITCRTIKHVVRGEARPVDEYTATFRTPAQGCGMFDEHHARVIELG